MNLNLNPHNSELSGQFCDRIAQDLEAHRQILMRACPGLKFHDTPVLVPARLDPPVPYVFEVWWAVKDTAEEEDPRNPWVDPEFLHVDADGRVARMDGLYSEHFFD